MAVKNAGRATRSWRKLRREKYAEAVRRAESGEPVLCWLCLMPIDMEITDPHDPGVWEPDHKIAVAKRPDLAEDPANVADSHRFCNNRKGDGLASNELGGLTRSWFTGNTQ